MSEKIRVLAIAPYQALKDTMLRVAKTKDNLELTVKVAAINQGAEIVKAYPADEYDVILSRGGTKMEIEKVTTKPVYEVPISHLDLLNIIKLVENYQGKIAILAYKNIAESARILCDIFHYDYAISSIDITHNAQEKVEALKAKGYTLIIGDAVAADYAESIGLQSILLVSGQASVEEAFNNIINTSTYYAHAQKTADFYNAFVDSQNIQLLVLEEKGQIAFSTLKAENRAMTAACTSLISSMQRDEVLIAHKKFREGLYMISGSCGRLRDKNLYFFRLQKSKAQRPHLSWSKSIGIYNQELFQNETGNKLTFIQALQSSFWTRCRSIAETNSPVLIKGEGGLEKEKLACQIYLQSKNVHNPLYIVSCAQLTEKELDYVLNNEKSPFYTLEGTIFFKDVQLLTTLMFETLLGSLRQMPTSTFSRLIFTYETNSSAEQKAKDDYRCASLTSFLGAMPIELPPLRDCIEDIPSYAVIYIHHHNQTSRTSIVGLEPEALNLLQTYDWPQNIHQFTRVLDEAMVATESSWITAKNISQILLTEKRAHLPKQILSPLNLKQTLDQIIYDTVTIILNEENMNQSQTAKRLGISRTTLWRLLRKGK